jgi:hypothetical protein
MKSQIIVGGLLILFAGPVAAQQEIPALTLEEAVQVARGRNPAFRRIQLGIRDAEARVLSAYGTFLPDLRASMGWEAPDERQRLAKTISEERSSRINPARLPAVMRHSL